jgi:hypothetical protein
MRVLQGCSKCVPSVLQGCFEGVTSVSQGCCKVVTKVLQGSLQRLPYRPFLPGWAARTCVHKSVTRVLQGC